MLRAQTAGLSGQRVGAAVSMAGQTLGGRTRHGENLLYAPAGRFSQQTGAIRGRQAGAKRSAGRSVVLCKVSSGAKQLSSEQRQLSPEPQHLSSEHRQVSSKQRQLSSDVIQRAAEQLRTQGWAVIEGVLTPEECKGYREGVWRWLGGLGGNISKEDPGSWDEARGWPPSFKGIINSVEVAHQDFVWRVRKHPKVVEVFSELYGTNELLSSFDSINITRPGNNCAGGWLHVDQAPLKEGVQCIQGIVNLVDVGPATTGTLMVKDESHRAHHEFFQKHTCLTPEQKAKTEDFYIFQPEELPYWDAYRRDGLRAKAGSLFIWDSRTAHQNAGPAKSTDWRHVVYVCYQPRSFAQQQDLDRKREAYENYLVTTHWPAKNVTVFPALGESESYYKTTPSKTDTSKMETSTTTDTSSKSGSTDGPAAEDSVNGKVEGSKAPAVGMGASNGNAKSGGGYWDEKIADGSAQRLLTSLRSRDSVEDAALLRLAGVQEYEAEEVWHKEPLLRLGS